MWLFPATFDISSWVEELTASEARAHNILGYNLAALYMHGCGLSACYRSDLFATLGGVFEVSASQARFHKRKHCYINLSSHYSSLPKNLPGSTWCQCREREAFNKWCWDKRVALWKDNNLEALACPTPCSKMNFRWSNGVDGKRGEKCDKNYLRWENAFYSLTQ